MTRDVPVDAIYRAARRMVWDPILAEDVAQTACLYALTQRRTRAEVYVIDAARNVTGRYEGRPGRVWRERIHLEHPEWIASHYSTPTELFDRWLDEQSEDQADEWLALTAAERSRRIADANRALGSSTDGR